jgi:hypothetical protein
LVPSASRSANATKLCSQPFTGAVIVVNHSAIYILQDAMALLLYLLNPLNKPRYNLHCLLSSIHGATPVLIQEADLHQLGPLVGT